MQKFKFRPGQLVELPGGSRLFIKQCTYDYEGTPIYSLTHSLVETNLPLRAYEYNLKDADDICYWDDTDKLLTDCGYPVIIKVLDNDDAHYCPYCGSRIEFWV